MVSDRSLNSDLLVPAGATVVQLSTDGDIHDLSL